ncbi:MAG: nuclear transport factor 2 family protein [Chitinophagaceae bacterium]|nr:nuclear transport factor 2 family protein [Chitinophagaceae bacterium]
MKHFLFLLLLTAASAATAQKTKEESATEKFVLRLHETKFRWMVNKRLDSLANILDERLQYIHSNGWVENKKEVIEDIRSGKLTMTKIVVSEAQARVYKGFVIVNGKGIFSIIMDGKPLDVSLLYTKVYAKRQNGWLLVSRHANRMP